MKKIVISFVIVILYCTVTLAGGYEGKGIGTRQLSMGGAAIGLADDWTAIYWNPAGMTNVEGAQLGCDFHVSLLEQHASHSLMNLPYPDYQKGNFRAYAPDEPLFFSDRDVFSVVYSGDFGYITNIGKVKFAVGFYGSAGIGNDWKDTVYTTSAKYFTNVVVFNVPFCFAYKFTDWFSAGINISLLIGSNLRDIGKTHVSLSSPADTYVYRSKSRALGTGVSADAGFLFTPLKWLSLGLLYRSPYLLYSKGEASYRHSAYPEPISGTKIPVMDSTRLIVKWFYPQRIGGGFALKPHPVFTLAFDVYWSNWSAMYFDNDYGKTTFYFYDMRLDFDLKNLWQFKVGVEVTPVRYLSLRLGFYTDPSPYRNPYGSLVTPRDSDALVYTGGLGVNIKGLHWDLSYNNVQVRDRRGYGTVVGGSVHVFSTGIRYDFM